MSSEKLDENNRKLKLSKEWNEFTDSTAADKNSSDQHVNNLNLHPRSDFMQEGFLQKDTGGAWFQMCVCMICGKLAGVEKASILFDLSS